jgi:hypothetical protein
VKTILGINSFSNKTFSLMRNMKTLISSVDGEGSRDEVRDE